jgi:predicted dehydrogenase
MKNTYRAAIVGLGNIAWRFDHNLSSKEKFLTHGYAYDQNDQTVLVGGCSPDEKDRNAFEKAFRIPSFSSLKELIERVEPDIVSICSPSKFHFKHVLYCLEQHIPMIWLEKPPAGSIQELDSMIAELSKHKGRSKILVNYQRRYSERYKKLKRIFLEKTLGKCRHIQLTYSKGLELNGSHIIDLLFFIVGDGTQCELQWISSFRDMVNPSFALNIENSLSVMVSGVSLPYHCIDISMVFESGRVSIKHGGMSSILEKKVEHELFPGFHRLKEFENGNLSSGPMKNSMGSALKDLIQSYEQGKETQSNLRSARSSLEIIERIRQRQRSPVS